MNKLMKIMEVICLMKQRIETLRYAAVIFPPAPQTEPSFDVC